MSVGDVAGLIAAVAFVLLVGILAIPLVKLGGVLDETRHMIKGVSDETVPLLNEVTTTVTTANAQLVRVDAITSNVQSATTNVCALTALLAATVGGPVVRSQPSPTACGRRSPTGRARPPAAASPTRSAPRRPLPAPRAAGARPADAPAVLGRRRGGRRGLCRPQGAEDRCTRTARRGLADRAVGTGAGLRAFADEVRAGMAEREAELRDALGMEPAHDVPLTPAEEADLMEHPGATTTGRPRDRSRTRTATRRKT